MQVRCRYYIGMIRHDAETLRTGHYRETALFASLSSNLHNLHTNRTESIDTLIEEKSICKHYLTHAIYTHTQMYIYITLCVFYLELQICFYKDIFLFLPHNQLNRFFKMM